MKCYIAGRTFLDKELIHMNMEIDHFVEIDGGD